MVPLAHRAGRDDGAQRLSTMTLTPFGAGVKGVRAASYESAADAHLEPI